eukprot:tig00001264_g7864.t1
MGLFGLKKPKEEPKSTSGAKDEKGGKHEKRPGKKKAPTALGRLGKMAFWKKRRSQNDASSHASSHHTYRRGRARRGATAIGLSSKRSAVGSQTGSQSRYSGSRMGSQTKVGSQSRGRSHASSNSIGELDELDEFLYPTGDGISGTKIELSVSCGKLRKVDLLTLADPICVMYQPPETQAGRSSSAWVEFGRTEPIHNNNSPKFSKTFVVDYVFEIVQPMRFAVYDVEWGRKIHFTEAHLIGEVFITMAEIMGAHGHTVTRRLTDPKKFNRPSGELTIKGEVAKNVSEKISFRFIAENLVTKFSILHQNKAFYVLARKEEGDLAALYTSETRSSNSPKWSEGEMTLNRFTGERFSGGSLTEAELDKELVVQVFHKRSQLKRILIGGFEFTVRDFMHAAKSGEKPEFKVINPAKARGFSFVNMGQTEHFGIVRLERAALKKQPTFTDYVSGGCEINLAVAIDFTASNGDPRLATSLHTMESEVPNEYVQAITAVGEVLANYDTDRRIPTFGFGGKLPDGEVSHCFPLNFNARDPACDGLVGILETYCAALEKVQLSGPTRFGPVLREVSKLARAAEHECEAAGGARQKYIVLLILTDGTVDDLEEAIKEIVAASSLPLSIVIVGVGYANFEAMEALDSDECMLADAEGNIASRDIVQFVRFADYRKKHYSKLARDTLKEIPDQLVSYFQDKRIAPNEALAPLEVEIPEVPDAEVEGRPAANAPRLPDLRFREDPSVEASSGGSHSADAGSDVATSEPTDERTATIRSDPGKARIR